MRCAAATELRLDLLTSLLAGWLVVLSRGLWLGLSFCCEPDEVALATERASLRLGLSTSAV